LRGVIFVAAQKNQRGLFFSGRIKLKILMVHPHDIFSTAEPWAIRIVSLAKEFAGAGHEVELIYFPLQWQGQGPSRLGGIICIPLSRRRGVGILLRNIFFLWRLARKADIVHFQKCFHYAVLPAAIAAFVSGRPLHYDWDDWEVKIYQVSTRKGVLRDLVRFFLHLFEENLPRISDTISVSSSRLKKECLRLGVPAENIFLAPVGADLKKFHPEVKGETVRSRYGINNRLVLYLGQLNGGQYAELFIEAAAKISAIHKADASFMIVGDGYRMEELKSLSRGRGLSERMIFTGAVSHNEAPYYIAAADVCVAPFKENEVTICKSPLKVAEYMASGKPIVANAVGEVPEMLGETGLLVPEGNIDALAQGVSRLLRDVNLSRQLGIAARNRAEQNYSWSFSANKILDAYRMSLSGGR